MSTPDNPLLPTEFSKMMEKSDRKAKDVEVAEDKYVYFLIGIASAAIALVVHQTAGVGFAKSQFCLGIAAGAWIISFGAGCLNRVFHIQISKEAIIGDLISNLKPLAILEAKEKKLDLTKLSELDPSFEQINKVFSARTERIRKVTAFCHRIQVVMLVLGGAFFLIWHLLEMSRLTK